MKITVEEFKEMVATAEDDGAMVELMRAHIEQKK
ncbi:MAG: hypothetical protein ACI906_001476 [Candidatus Latescibacterota bacterium]